MMESIYIFMGLSVGVFIANLIAGRTIKKLNCRIKQLEGKKKYNHSGKDVFDVPCWKCGTVNTAGRYENKF